MSFFSFVGKRLVWKRRTGGDMNFSGEIVQEMSYYREEERLHLFGKDVSVDCTIAFWTNPGVLTMALHLNRKIRCSPPWCIHSSGCDMIGGERNAGKSSTRVLR